ncbi:MAG: hypothetical protein H6996_05245 [Moraxellaceae bacterium]|nr:hypothetical protein [Pseudomonadales bacterium]MCP5174498.1 hypothetical protein [Moraxellaceae bacterium]
MSRIEALEHQVQQLAPQDLAVFSAWFHQFELQTEKAKCAISGMTAEQSVRISQEMAESLRNTNYGQHSLIEA